MISSDHTNMFSGAKCYHMTLRLASDRFILKVYSNVIQFNIVEVGAGAVLFKKAATKQ